MSVNMTEEEMSKLALKLYKLQFDPYTQLGMFDNDADAVVWNLTAIMVNGDVERIDVTYFSHGDLCTLDNPYLYRLTQYTPSGYKQIPWELIAEIN
jgi:hypothetical protein